MLMRRPFAAGNVAAMGGPFTPAALGPSGWYDPSDLSSMWQESAGTTPAAVDSPVGKMNDKSGNNNHVTQATSTKRPILRQTGALYYLEFDGVDDFLSGTIPSFGANLSKTFVMGLKLAALSGSNAAFTYGAAGATFGFNAYNAGSIQIFQWGPDLSFAGGATTDQVATGIKNTNELTSRRNGVVNGGPTTVAGVNVTSTNLHIGCVSDGSAHFAGRMYGLVLVLGTPSLTDIEAWMAAKSGVTL